MAASGARSPKRCYREGIPFAKRPAAPCSQREMRSNWISHLSISMHYGCLRPTSRLLRRYHQLRCVPYKRRTRRVHQRYVAGLACPSIGGSGNKGSSIINQRSLRLAFPSRAVKLAAMSSHSIRETESGGGDGIFRVWRRCLYPPADKSIDHH